jgi:hypothetical protein
MIDIRATTMLVRFNDAARFMLLMQTPCPKGSRPRVTADLRLKLNKQLNGKPTKIAT